MRLDRYLVEVLDVRSRSLAAELIELGLVTVKESGRAVKVKPSLKVLDGHKVQIQDHPLLHVVSRSALKLAGALDHLEKPVKGLTAIDVGQSTGGFTQVLLERGAERVIGVDVGHDQLDQALLSDARVQSFEGLNAKDLSMEWLMASCARSRVDLIVMDVSFISISQVLPALSGLTPEVLSLVKPQFELSSHQLDKAGVVADERFYADVEQKIRDCARQNRFEVLHYFESSIAGRDGNREFFVSLRALV